MRRNSIGLLKVSLRRRHKTMRPFVLVLVIIKFLDPVVVMLSSFPTPIATQFSNAVLSATTDTVEVASGIRRSGRLAFSRVLTPPRRWATCSDSSTSEACSIFPLAAGSIFRFCGLPRTACRAVCPSSKHSQRILRVQWQFHFDTRADVRVFRVVDGSRTTSYLFCCIRLPTGVPGVTTIKYSAPSPCRCPPSTRFATALKWENRPVPSNHMSLQNCPAAHGTAQNILGCSV
jgi:hypothetical protein